MASRPYRIMLPEELIDRLEHAAADFQRRTGNQVASEICQMFFESWLEAEEARWQVVRERTGPKPLKKTGTHK